MLELELELEKGTRTGAVLARGRLCHGKLGHACLYVLPWGGDLPAYYAAPSCLVVSNRHLVPGRTCLIQLRSSSTPETAVKQISKEMLQ